MKLQTNTAYENKIIHTSSRPPPPGAHEWHSGIAAQPFAAAGTLRVDRTEQWEWRKRTQAAHASGARGLH